MAVRTSRCSALTARHLNHHMPGNESLKTMDWDIAEDMVETLKMLAHPVRLQIIASLGNEEQSVGQIAATVDREPAFISRQLSIMKRYDMLTRTRSGRRVYYRIHDSKMVRLAKCVTTVCDKKVTNRS